MNKAGALVIDIQYFGNINYYSALINSKHIIFDLYVPFQKSTFLNRCTLPGPNGLIDLSIPLVGGRDQKGRLTEMKIANRYPWQEQHLRTFSACYGRSPWFEHYFPGLKDLYEEKEEYLIPFLIRSNDWIFASLKMNENNIEYNTGVKIDVFPSGSIRYGDDENFSNVQGMVGNESEEQVQKTIDLRYKILPKNPRLERQPMLKYPQVFEERNGFIPDLSILDLLFCEGPAAKKILMGE